MGCILKKFNKKQIEKCKGCRHASDNVNHPAKIGWCGKYAVRIDDPAKRNQSQIIQPSRKIITQPPLQMPSRLQQGKNFAAASAAHVAAGMKSRTDQEAAKCMGICKACEFFDGVRQRCSKCGCFMKVKTRWQSAHCPVGKW